MNETLTLKSGREMTLQMASFSVGMKLFKTIAREVKSVDIELETVDMAKLAGKDLNSIKNVVFQLVSSDAVEACVFDCLKSCLLDSVKITKDTFEDEDMRGDFLPCAWEVIKFNLRPFMSGLDLSSLASPADPKSGQQ